MLIPELGVHQTSERYFFTPSSLAKELFITRRGSDITSAAAGIPSIIGRKSPCRVITTKISCCFLCMMAQWS